MIVGPPRLAQPRVRDVSDQSVLEAERALARDRRVLLRQDQLAIEQAVERGPPSSPARWSSAPRQNTRPPSAACWSSRFSAGSSRSMRAAMSACTVSGIRSSAVSSSVRIRAVSSRKSGFPSAFSSRRARCAGARRRARGARRRDRPPRPPRAGRARRRARADCPRPRSACARAAPAARRRRSASARPELAGDVLQQVEELLLRPVDVLEHEHERLHLCELLRPAPGRPPKLLAGAARPAPRGRRARRRAARRRPRSRSRSAASPRLRPTESSSEMPADVLTIDASGKYVTPSPYGRARPNSTVARSSPR